MQKAELISAFFITCLIYKIFNISKLQIFTIQKSFPMMTINNVGISVAKHYSSDEGGPQHVPF